MNSHPAFSADYRSARQRFREGAVANRFQLESHPIDEAADLTVDVAIGGDPEPNRLVIVSSGLHGVEGFLGSAIQNSILEDDPRTWTLPPRTGLILIHALDPFGYAHLRRFDESNVDLNRNFLLDGASYSGSPEIYREIQWLLNPKRPPGRFDLLAIESIPAVLRHGEAALKRAIAGGQFDFPLGLFFGGHGPSKVRRLLEMEMPRWVAGASSVTMLDVHTGLGRWGDLTLLLEETVKPERVRVITERFDDWKVEWWGHGIAYPTRGGLGSWCQARFADVTFDFICAEFGTYGGRRVLAALRAENQSHHWGEPGSRSTLRAKRTLVEAFAPADPEWRGLTLERGRSLVRRACELESNAVSPG